MKTKFDQKMVTIEISDHHMDEKDMRDERLYRATLAFAKAVRKSVDDGTFKKMGMPDVSCVCLFSEDSRFSGKFIQVLIYGRCRRTGGILYSGDGTCGSCGAACQRIVRGFVRTR